MTRSIYWTEMTASDFVDAGVRHWIAVLPVAAIEQHGPHLPLSTDAAIAEGLLGRVAGMLPPDIQAVLLPVQSIGKSNEHIDFAGTLTLSWETAVRSWIEIGESVWRAGIRKLVIITSHGGNIPVIDIVARELRVSHGMLVIATSWQRLGTPYGVLSSEEASYGIHAGDEETSMMLALRPDLVRMPLAEKFTSSQQVYERDFLRLRGHGSVQFGWKMGDLNERGAVGNAAAATADKGWALINHRAEGFIEVLRDVMNFNPSWLGSRPLRE
jgi:creatinine amidohydrolase